jgi:geranylgeranyl diphosphate synthase type I
VSGPDEAVVTRVDAVLAAFLDERAESLGRVGPELAPIAEAASRLVLDGGKRLRPRFAYWGWRAVLPDDAPDDDLIVAAASLELLHACALAHDDLMDSSATRRGKPTTHVTFAQRHADAGWSGSSEAFGAAAAILLGDLLLAWADTLFARASMPVAAQRVYDDMRQMVMAGQYLDVLVQARAEFSPEDALRVAEFKTSKYTVEGPLHLGAAAAGAGLDVLAALSAYALPLGVAFQLRDDVLGVFGDPELTGKPAGDDLREGKHTLLTALAIQAADPAQAMVMRADLGRRDLGTEQISTLRKIIVGTGALDAVEARIAVGADQARAALADDALSSDARASLAELVGAATQRHT